jgi:translation initiation factor IF-3
MQKKSFPQKRNEKRINENIIARELMVISETGEPLGKMSRDRALDLAGSKDLDLIEVGMQEGIPLTKILDYGKFQYEQQKQQAHNKQHTKKTELKTMKLTYKIGEHDLDIRRKQAEWWAKEWNPMRITLQLRGRENQYETLAREKIEEFIASLEHVYKKDPAMKIAKLGSNFNITLYPKK